MVARSCSCRATKVCREQAATYWLLFLWPLFRRRAFSFFRSLVLFSRAFKDARRVHTLASLDLRHRAPLLRGERGCVYRVRSVCWQHGQAVAGNALFAL